jgi:hypothetical protein
MLLACQKFQFSYNKKFQINKREGKGRIHLTDRTVYIIISTQNVGKLRLFRFSRTQETLAKIQFLQRR